MNTARAFALIRSVNPLGRHETITLVAHGYNLLGSPVFNLDPIHPAIPFPVNCIRLFRDAPRVPPQEPEYRRTISKRRSSPDEPE